IDVDPKPVKSARKDGVFRTSNDRRSESDDLVHEVRPLARNLTREIAAKAPADHPHALPGLSAQRGDALQNPGHQVGHLAAVAPPSPAAHMIPKQSEVSLE